MFLAVKSIFVQAEFQKAFKNCEVCILVLSYSQRDLFNVPRCCRYFNKQTPNCNVLSKKRHFLQT